MPLQTQLDEAPTLNLTSMIDVLFLLIIFFMLGARFSEEDRRLGLNLPRVADSKSLGVVRERWSVNVYRDGQVEVGSQLVTDQELRTKLMAEAKRNRQLSIVLRGDADVPLQRIVNVLATCRDCGVSEVGVAARRAKRER